MSGFTQVCVLSDIAPRTAKRVIVEGVAIAVVRADEGVYAINDRCSHADVSLADGEVDGCSIECWLHGSAFDLRTGMPLSLPAFTPVATYPLRLIGEGATAVVEIDPTPLPSPAQTR